MRFHEPSARGRNGASSFGSRPHETGMASLTPLRQPTRREALDRTLALGVAAIALFSALSALSMPVRERRAPSVLVAVWTVLLLAHALFYWRGAVIRTRWGARAYIGIQAAAAFAIGLSGELLPVVLAVYVALTVDVVVLAGSARASLLVTTGTIALFAATAVITHNLYQSATAGLLLGVTGFIAHAIAVLTDRAPATPPARMVAAAPESGQGPSSFADSGLTDREVEVLGAMVTGARNNQIATDLGIAERTVKAHLASVYRKLGVTSRAGAIRAALTRGWFP